MHFYLIAINMKWN